MSPLNDQDPLRPQVARREARPFGLRHLANRSLGCRAPRAPRAVAVAPDCLGCHHQALRRGNRAIVDCARRSSRQTRQEGRDTEGTLKLPVRKLTRLGVQHAHGTTVPGGFRSLIRLRARAHTLAPGHPGCRTPQALQSGCPRTVAPTQRRFSRRRLLAAETQRAHQPRRPIAPAAGVAP